MAFFHIGSDDAATTAFFAAASAVSGNTSAVTAHATAASAAALSIFDRIGWSLVVDAFSSMATTGASRDSTRSRLASHASPLAAATTVATRRDAASVVALDRVIAGETRRDGVTAIAAGDVARRATRGATIRGPAATPDVIVDTGTGVLYR